MLVGMEFKDDPPVAAAAAEGSSSGPEHTRVSAIGIVGHCVESDIDALQIVGGDPPKIPLSGTSYQ